MSLIFALMKIIIVCVLFFYNSQKMIWKMNSFLKFNFCSVSLRGACKIHLEDLLLKVTRFYSEPKL